MKQDKIYMKEAAKELIWNCCTVREVNVNGFYRLEIGR